MRVVVIGLVAGSLSLAGCATDGSAGGASAQDRGTRSSSSSKPASNFDPATVPAKGSAGCDAAAVAAGETKETLTSGGAERWYYRHVPTGYDGAEPRPLVLDFHGYSEGAEIHRQMSGSVTSVIRRASSR